MDKLLNLTNNASPKTIEKCKEDTDEEVKAEEEYIINLEKELSEIDARQKNYENNNKNISNHNESNEFLNEPSKKSSNILSLQDQTQNYTLNATQILLQEENEAASSENDILQQRNLFQNTDRQLELDQDVDYPLQLGFFNESEIQTVTYEEQHYNAQQQSLNQQSIEDLIHNVHQILPNNQTQELSFSQFILTLDDEFQELELMIRNLFSQNFDVTKDDTMRGR